MNKSALIMSCGGALLVTLNKPIGKAFNWANHALGAREYDPWAYRAPLIFFGVLLALLSLIPE
ncbi:MAG: hypothetical protein ACJ74Q_06885 [Pyrinomonadaceae bacterium]